MNLIINKTNSTDLQFQQKPAVLALQALAPMGRTFASSLVNIEPDPQRSKKSNSKTLGPERKGSPTPKWRSQDPESIRSKFRAKIVTFDNVLIIYYFKDYEDRKGYWIENRCHFQRHCNRIQEIISFIFQDEHRDKIQKLIHKWAEDYLRLGSALDSSTIQQPSSVVLIGTVVKNSSTAFFTSMHQV